MDPKELAGKTAVVTGGASGIGHETGRLLAQCGAEVFIGDFDLLPGQSQQPDQDGLRYYQCDVRSEDDVSRLIAAAGDVSILVNSAGVGLAKQIPDVEEEEWDACFDTNVKGTFLCCKHAIRRMRALGGGTIVNVASNAGLLPRSHDPVYSTSKGALVALTRSFALCHAPDRIRINAVCPGPVADTRMMNADLDAAADRDAAISGLLTASPLADAFSRMIAPQEVAAAVVYLCSEAAEMVTGTCIAIDGGKSLGVPPGTS